MIFKYKRLKTMGNIIISRFLPGGESQSGFIAHGESVSAVIKSDAKDLKSVNITHDQIADKLEYIYKNVLEI